MVKYSRYQKAKPKSRKAGNTIQKLYKMIKKVKSYNKPELKTVDRITYYNPESFIWANTNWAWQCVSGVAQGTTFENRLGIEVVANSIQIKGLIRAGTSQTQVNDVKMVIIMDTDGIGTSPDTTNIFKFDSFYSPISLDTQPRRYKILASRTFTIMPDNTGDSTKPINMYVKLNRRKLYYTGNSAAFSDTRKNAIWVGFCSAKSETTNANYPRMNFMSRFRFFDE